MHPLHPLFNPSAIAIIGASEVPGKAAERRTRSLIEGGFSGKIYLINPKRKELFGKKAYPSVLDVPGPIDLAMIVIPPRFIPQAVSDSVKMGAKGIVIITAGMGETGEEGKQLESEALRIAVDGGAKIVGPNCSGLFSAGVRMNLLGIPAIPEGPLAVIAQSGNIIDSLTHYAQMKKVGLRTIISAGNAIGVQFHEYIDYLNQDPDTRVIMMYMEGITAGDKLVQAARKVSIRKPVIVLKVGRTGAGMRAAASHTGSLAVDDAIVDAAFKQAGIIRVHNVDEMFDAAVCFANLPLPGGRQVAIISEGGGDNSVAADNAQVHGLEVPVLPASTQEKIRPCLLSGMAAGNPIDYGGTAEENPEMISRITGVLMEEPLVHAVYITGFFGGFKEIIAPHVGELEERTARAIVELVRKHGKPVVVHSSFANSDFKSMEILRDSGILLTPSSERAARCLAYMADFSQNREKLKAPPLAAPVDIDAEAARQRLEEAGQAGRTNLTEPEARQLLELYGISLPGASLAKTPQEAVTAANSIGYPVAMKIVSPQIVHKSDAGGIMLSLNDEKTVEKAFRTITANAGKVTDPSQIFGVLIAPMAPEGQECIIGMARSPQFGPVMMFGLGGVFVEVLKDVSLRVVPLTKPDIDGMVQEINGYPLLAGIRGNRPKDIGVLKDIILRTACMAADHPEISEIDLNPVIVHETGASIVDARIILEQRKEP